MKKLLAVLLAFVLLLSVTACGAQEEELSPEAVVVNVGALQGPTGISAAKLANDAKESGKYAVAFAGAPDEIAAKLINGELDAACIPTNLASVLYNKTGGKVKVAAVTTLGVLYLLDASGEAKTIGDLRGKIVYATGQGSNPEYILNYILEKNGLVPGTDVLVEYKTEHAELASRMIAGRVTLAMLPVPFATQVKAKLENVSSIDLQTEWAKVSDAQLAQGVLVVRSEFAEQHPDECEALLADFAASAEYAVANAEDTAAMTAELGIIASAETALAAIPACNIVFITGEEMKNTVSGFLEVLFASAPASVGQAMPGDDFYFGVL